MTAREFASDLHDHAGCVLRVHGRPAPQGSKTAYVRGGRAIVTEGKGPGRESHAAWRQAVATTARDWLDRTGSPAFDEAVRVLIRFDLPRGKSVRRRLPTVKPDIDKLARSVLDALVDAGLLLDDSLVTHLECVKAYGTHPGATVVVTEVHVDGGPL